MKYAISNSWKQACCWAVAVLLPQLVGAQQSTGSSYPQLSYKQPNDTLYRFAWRQCAAPAVALGMAVAQGTPWMKAVNSEVKNRVGKIGFRNGSDDYLQYAPMAVGLGLDAVGIYGRHHILDKSIILATAALAELALVNGMKYSIGTLRPDGSAHNSFPSGHTATVFMAAEFLRREYGHKSVWYGIGGYAVATFTGYMRIQNNRHWLSDVVAGAGIGIFSTQLAYWAYPALRKGIFPKQKSRYSFLLMPCYYSSQQVGLSAAVRF
jgi:membrane-associated phospholipid phosphatase